jgi:hypothetical protein
VKPEIKIVGVLHAHANQDNPEDIPMKKSAPEISFARSDSDKYPVLFIAFFGILVLNRYP